MARGARSSPQTSRSSSFGSLERSLDRTIEFLTSSAPTAEVRALLIEAKRLRSVVANWRSIPPAPDVHDEMLDRVLHLSTAAGTSLYEDDNVANEYEQGVLAQDDAGDGRDFGDDNEVYSLDYEPHLYSLDGPGHGLRAKRGGTPVRHAVREELPPPSTDERYEVYSEPPPSESPAPTISYEEEEEPQQQYQYTPARGRPPERLATPHERIATRPPHERLATPQERIATRPPQEKIATRPPQERIASQPAVRATSEPPPAPRAGGTGSRAAAAPTTQSRELGAPTTIEEPGQTQITVHPGKAPETVDPLIVMLKDTYSDRADAYRNLRRKLASAGNPRMVAVTSATPGEGKTTLAVNLALVLREGARGRVLLIEANLRSPRLAKLFEFEPPECFVQQLASHREEPDKPWVAVEPLPQLHVMAIDGSAKHAPLLDAVAFSSGMAQLKQASYEYIVVDTPPVLGSVDCNLIADAVDGMIFASIQMKSKKGPFKKAIEQIQPAPILGVVVLDAW